MDQASYKELCSWPTSLPRRDLEETRLLLDSADRPDLAASLLSALDRREIARPLLHLGGRRSAYFDLSGGLPGLDEIVQIVGSAEAAASMDTSRAKDGLSLSRICDLLDRWIALRDELRPERRVELLAELLLDESEVDLTVRDDAAMYLANYATDASLNALIRIATDPEAPELLVSTAGESIGIIWKALGRSDPDVWMRMLAIARSEAGAYVIDPELQSE